MKKQHIALLGIAIVLIAFLVGFLMGRRNSGDPIDVSNSGENSTSVTQNEPAPQEEIDDETEDVEIDESLVPILPEISVVGPEVEEPEADDMLTVVFFGDSQFENGSSDKTDIPHLVHNYIHTRVLNLGVGGTCAALVPNDSDDLDNWDNFSFYGMTLMLQGRASRAALEGRNQLTVMEAVDPSTVDYYVVSYGINDFLNGIRPHIDGQENVPRNYYGALDMGIKVLREISPQAQIIVCSPTYTQFFNAEGRYIGDSHVHDYGLGVFDEFANQAAHVANANSCLYLDAAFDTMVGINGYTANKFLMDGIHLTENGRKAYALALSYIIAKDQGWTSRPMERIDIDHLDWASEFLEDIPSS